MTCPEISPDSDDKQQQQADFDHIAQLTATIKAEEIFNLPANELLYRLYHEQQVLLFDPQPVAFICGCSADKCLSAIANLGKEGIKQHLAEHHKISMTCDFCNTKYIFDEEKLKPLLQPN